MSLQSQVLRLLEGSTAARIRFSINVGYGRLSITRQAFRDVADAIRGGTLSVALPGTMRAGVAAQYVSASNRIEVPPIHGRVQEGLLLHECLHAYFDISRTGIVMVDEESAAYVVSSLYFRMTNVSGTRWSAPLHAAAGAVANDLLGAYQRGDVAVPRADGANWDALQTAVKAHPVYSGILGYSHAG